MSHIPNKHWNTPHKPALQTQAKLVESEILYAPIAMPLLADNFLHNNTFLLPPVIELSIAEILVD
jgi:hypothetical protein